MPDVVQPRDDSRFVAIPERTPRRAWPGRRQAGGTASTWIADRATLEAKYESLQAEFGDRPVPRPTHWGGYRITPDRIEFWKAGTYRLHQRHVYVREGTAWRVELLYP